MAAEERRESRKRYPLCEKIIFVITSDCSMTSGLVKKGERIILLSNVIQVEQPPHMINTHAKTLTKLDGGGGSGNITCGSKFIVFSLNPKY